MRDLQLLLKYKCSLIDFNAIYLRYPADESSFAFSGLPGHFESSMAGKRMKLKTPETWETQIAK